HTAGAGGGSLMTARAAEETCRVQICLRSDERLRHPGQQPVADGAHARPARGAAESVISAVRRGLVHDDPGHRIRLSHVVHGAYLSPGFPARLQTWKSRPQTDMQDARIWRRHRAMVSGTAFVGGPAP